MELFGEYPPVVDDEIELVNVWIVCGLLSIVGVELAGENQPIVDEKIVPVEIWLA